MFETHFNTQELIFLSAAGLLFTFSWIMFSKKQLFLSIGLLVLSALFINFFAISLDEFLNLWDERFHALVAKNMMKHPFKPMLYSNPVMDIDYDRWDRYIIWLHKQPLFLWQSAISMKLFGVNEFAFRLPNAILGAITVIAFYRSGKLFRNEFTGYISAILFMSSFYCIEVLSGRQMLDQNDYAFMCYISLSIWSLIEYQYTGKKHWLILIGLFSGMAILCKWLVGLIVYAGWVPIKFNNFSFKLKYYGDITISFLITCFIFLPWQIFTFYAYPAEAAASYKFNNQHIWEPIEGHGGDFWYHFTYIDDIFGKFIPFIIVPAIVLFLIRSENKSIVYGILSIITVAYLFFSVVATKMPSFTLVLVLPMFLIIADFIQWIIQKIHGQFKLHRGTSMITGILLFFLLVFRMKIIYLQEVHTKWKSENTYTEILEYNRKKWNELKFNSDMVVVNIPGVHYIEGMFYSNISMYRELPNEKQLNNLFKKNLKVVVMSQQNENFPEYITKNKKIIIISNPLKSNW